MPLKFDVTELDATSNFDRRARYGADTLPSVVFMSADGKVLGRVNKLIEPDDFLTIVNKATKQLPGAGPTASSK